MTRSSLRILIADSNPATRNSMAQLLNGAGYETVEAVSGEHAIMAFEETPADLVMISPISQHRLVDRAVVRWFRSQVPRVPVMLMVGWDLTEEWNHQFEADDWIFVPAVFDDLVEKVRHLIGPAAQSAN